MKQNYSEKLDAFISEEKAATKLMHSVSSLLYEKGIELVLFRRHLLDENVSEILRLHQYASDFVKKPISIFESSSLANELTKMDLAPSKIDIGKLAYEYNSEKSQYKNIESFLNEKIGFIKNSKDKHQKSKDVVLFGFGRIGRLCARELIKLAGKGQQLRLKGVILRKIESKSLQKSCALLRQDSVHGSFASSIEIDEDNFNGLVNTFSPNPLSHENFLSSNNKPPISCDMRNLLARKLLNKQSNPKPLALGMPLRWDNKYNYSNNYEYTCMFFSMHLYIFPIKIKKMY